MMPRPIFLLILNALYKGFQMRYHLFQKLFGKMDKIKETSFLFTRKMDFFERHCTLSWDPMAINFHKKFHPLHWFGTLRQSRTLEFAPSCTWRTKVLSVSSQISHLFLYIFTSLCTWQLVHRAETSVGHFEHDITYSIKPFNAILVSSKFWLTMIVLTKFTLLLSSISTVHAPHWKEKEIL